MRPARRAAPCGSRAARESRDGGPSRIRTCGLRIRSPALYPSELWVLIQRLAEREGFEPSIQLWAVYWFSKPAPSASRPPLPVFVAHLISPGTEHPGKRRLLDHAPGSVKANDLACGRLPARYNAPDAPVAQLDRAAAFEAAGRRFDSCQARHSSRGQTCPWSS